MHSFEFLSQKFKCSVLKAMNIYLLLINALLSVDLYASLSNILVDF